MSAFLSLVSPSATPAGLSPWLALRLAIWREVHARWPLFLVGPLMLGLGATRGPDIRHAVEMFVLLLLLPPFVAIAAARPGADADSFWRGLGGPSWAAPVGAALVHLPVFGVTAAAALFGLRSDGSFLDRALALQQSEVLVPVALALVYATTAAARSLAGGGAVMAGPMLGVCLLVVSGGLGLLIWNWAPLDGLRWRASGLLVAAAVVTVWWEGAFGARGGGLRLRAWRSVAGVAVALLALGLGAEVLLPQHQTSYMSSVSEDGLTIVNQPVGVYWWERTGWAQEWRDGTAKRVGPRGAVASSLGPHGSRLFHVDPGLGPDPYTQIEFADGTVVECPEDDALVQWRSDGMGALFDNFIAGPSGCTPLESDDRWAVGWLGDELVWRSPRPWQIGVGPRPAPDRLWLGDELLFEESERRIWVSAAGDTIVVNLHPRRYARSVPANTAPREVWLVQPDGRRQLLVSSSGVLGASAVPDGVCRTVLEPEGGPVRGRCWTLEGELVVDVELPSKKVRFVDFRRVFEPSEGRVRDLQDGRTWAAPDGRVFAWSLEYRRLVMLPDGETLRHLNWDQWAVDVLPDA